MSDDLLPQKILDCLRDPASAEGTDAPLLREEGGFRGSASGEFHADLDGVPALFVPEADDTQNVADRIRAFYEENPFPNYDGVEEFGDLVSKGHQNSFSADLLAAIGHNKTVLECGCGTGQLSHFLQLNNNHVLGVDMTISSLQLALEHKKRNALARSAFTQMNIFNMPIRDNSFDVVISQGVLHHTQDARRAFASMVRKVKPGGLVVVGLYNYYARVPTWLRSKLIGTFGSKLDYVVRNRISDARKADIWVKDQYYNPHETWHSIDEVMGWFKENGIEYLNCAPAILDTDGEEADSLVAQTDAGNKFQRVMTQLFWLGTIAREGALFDLFGRKTA